MVTDNLDSYNSFSSSDDSDDAAHGVWRVSERSSLFANDEGKGSPDTRSAGEDTEFSQGSTVMSNAPSPPSIPQPDHDAPLMDDAYFFNVLYSPQLQADGVQVWTRDYVRAAMYYRERRVSQAARQTAYSLNLDPMASSSSSELLSPKTDSPSRLQNLDSNRAPRVKPVPVQATRTAAAPPALPARSLPSPTGRDVSAPSGGSLAGQDVSAPSGGSDGKGRGRSLLRVVQGVLVLVVVSTVVIAAASAAASAMRAARADEQRCHAEAKKGWRSWLPGVSAAASVRCEAEHRKWWSWFGSVRFPSGFRAQRVPPVG